MRLARMRPVRPWVYFLAVAWLLFLCAPASAQALDILVVLSGDSEPYRAIAERLQSSSARERLGRVRSIDVSELDQLNRSRPSVVVAVGLKATQAAVARDTGVPIICTLIPQASFDQIAGVNQRKPRSEGPERGKHAPLTAVYLDQPIARQLELIGLALPGKKRIGALVGPGSAAALDTLRVEGQKRGMEVNAARMGSESALFPALESVLGEVDVLLSLPDSVVFNSRTIPSVLFTSYRFRTPVIGFSPAYVQAGALVAVHSTPTQLADQVADMLARFRTDGSLPPPQYPDRFTVTVNRQVARSLDLALEQDDVLTERLRRGRDVR